ncbi:hypothetical protein GCM10009853_068570 [Glycomyces scopariae]|uniref:Uncharacterized protein n=1 Tax=Glycomyces sambucus TaxID=380244 RepID=A0A1G9KZV9_9ACTN|nr:hypothetical protein [Glycomyces sambucus]SDL55084.1 hypothetical protein SAMN05216298_4329 [Glycomyces sambucus]
MTYPPQSPEPHQYGAPGPQGPAPQQGGTGDFATEWGIKEHPGRPKKVNQLTQLLWAYFGLSVLMLLFAIVGVATAPWYIATGFIVASGIVGLVFHGLSIGIAYFITKDKLGVFNAQDPRLPLWIGLGLLGLFSLGGLWGGWGWFAALSVIIGLARLAAVGAGFFLLSQPEVVHYLRSRPGNQPKTPPQGGYAPQQGGYAQQPPQQGYPQQQPAPGYPQQQPPNPGQQQAPPPGYPQQ